MMRINRVSVIVSLRGSFFFFFYRLSILFV